MDHWADSAGFDRVEAGRTDPEWVAAQWELDDARLLRVDADGRVATGAEGRLLFEPTAGRYRDQAQWLLGRTGEMTVFTEESAVSQGRTLRDLARDSTAVEVELATAAVALAGWHRLARYCGFCGGDSDVGLGGLVRHCRSCGRDRFPRSDPAVIVAVLDPDDRLLLGRAQAWPERRMSLLAGFVGAGESLEQAVRREVAEESGVRVEAVSYLASQPWPFPRSLMVGFRAATADRTVTPDGIEIVEARFFSRAELEEALTDGSLSLPAVTSIARRIIDAWRAGALPVLLGSV